MEPIPQSNQSAASGLNPYKRHLRTSSQPNLTQDQYGPTMPLRAYSPPSPHYERQQAYQAVDTSEFRRSQALLRNIRQKEAEFLQRQNKMQPLSTTQHLRQSMQELSLQDSFNKSSSLEIGQHLASSQDHQTRRNYSSPLRHEQPQSVQLPQPSSLDLQQMNYADKLLQDNLKLDLRVNQAQSELDQLFQEQQRLQRMHDDIVQETNLCKQEIAQLDRPADTSIHDEIAKTRHQNNMLTGSIQAADRTRVEAVKKLRFLQQRRQGCFHDGEDRKVEMQQKLQIMREIEAKRAYETQKLDRVERQIQALQMELINENRMLDDDEKLLEKLCFEREDLIVKLDRLHAQYQVYVAESESERRVVVEHSKRQAQILASRAMFNTLESLAHNKQQQAFNNFLFYCNFDEKCHKSLQRFANILQKLAKLKITFALRIWYSNGFNPHGVLQQQRQIVIKKSDKQLETQIASQLIEKATELQDRRQDWQRAFKVSVQVLDKFESKDKVWALTIWRDSSRDQNQRERMLRRVLLRTYDQRRQQAFRRLAERSQQHKAFAQRQVLCVSSASRQALLAILVRMREVLSIQKQKRLRKLGLIFKALKDGIAYFKLIKCQDVATVIMRRQTKRRLMAEIFMELRLTKELEKFCLMNENLQTKMIPQCSQLQEQIMDIATRSLKKRKIRGMQCLARYSLSGAAGYFNKWRQINFYLKNRSGDYLKSFLFRIYRSTMHKAVLRWRNGVRFYQRCEQNQIAEAEAITESDFIKQIKSLNHEVFVEDYRVSAYRQRSLTSAINIFNKRAQNYGLQRWKSQITKINANLYKASLLIKAKWKILTRSAFKRYFQKVQEIKHEIDQERRAQHYQWVTKLRLKRKIFQTLYEYVQTFLHSQRYWGIVLANLDMWCKRRAMVRWLEQSRSLSEQEQRKIQGENSEKFDQMNEVLGLVTMERTTLESQCKHLGQEMKIQGQRSLAYCIVRQLMRNTALRFKQWREQTQNDLHRLSFLKSILLHQEKWKFYNAKQAFKNWVGRIRCYETVQKIRYLEALRMDELSLAEAVKKGVLSTKQLIRLEVYQKRKDLDQLSQTVERFVKVKIALCKNFFYQSTRRHIFKVWSNYVRRQKRFLMVITNVLSKHQWKQGFTQIINSSDLKRQLHFRKIVAIGMVRMYFKKRCGKALSQWRQHRYNKTIEETANLLEVIQITEIKHQEYRDRVSSVNCLRSEKIIVAHRKANLFKAFKNVQKWQKFSTIKTEQHAKQTSDYNVVRSLKHWFTRTKLTIVCRDRVQKFKQAKSLIYKKMLLNALKKHKVLQRSASNTIAQISTKLETYLLQSAFSNIFNYKVSKDICFHQNKESAALKLSQSLNYLHKKLLGMWFSQFKHKVTKWSINQTKLKRLRGYWYARSLRHSFMLWVQKASLASTVEDVNEDGPIVEQVLTNRLRLVNMANLMREEGFSKEQIATAAAICESKTQVLMRRSLSRLARHVKPIAFDRWRQFVQLRKLVRYLLRLTENRLQPGRADLSFAFNKWRIGIVTRITQLQQSERFRLVQKAVVTDSKLLKLDEEGAYKNDVIVAATNERDQLFNGYVSAKRLAIALGRDSCDRSLHKAFVQLESETYKQKQSQLQALLMKNVEHISQLKERSNKIEQENKVLLNDNEGLRQTSLDGFEIGRGAEQLSHDRERLSIDLADKARQIKRLFEMNQQLTAQLRQQLDRTSLLVQQQQQ